MKDFFKKTPTNGRRCSSSLGTWYIYLNMIASLKNMKEFKKNTY